MCDKGIQEDGSSQLAAYSGGPGGLCYDSLMDLIIWCRQRTWGIWYNQ